MAEASEDTNGEEPLKICENYKNQNYKKQARIIKTRTFRTLWISKFSEVSSTLLVYELCFWLSSELNLSTTNFVIIIFI